MTEEEYQAKALDLLKQEVSGDIEGYETKRGKVVRWNKSTNDYAVGKLGKSVLTMFPLRGGQERFNELWERDKKEDITDD